MECGKVYYAGTWKGLEQSIGGIKVTVVQGVRKLWNFVIGFQGTKLFVRQKFGRENALVFLCFWLF